MESHASGGITPLSIGELRQSILAVLVGNPLFTEEEQLIANHLTYECEDAERLAKWLRNVRLQDAQRGRIARWAAAFDADQQAVCISKAAHLVEMEALVQCRALNIIPKKLLLRLMTGAGDGTGDRLQWLGHACYALLEGMGRIPQPKAFNALKDN